VLCRLEVGKQGIQEEPKRFLLSERKNVSRRTTTTQQQQQHHSNQRQHQHQRRQSMAMMSYSSVTYISSSVASFGPLLDLSSEYTASERSRLVGTNGLRALSDGSLLSCNDEDVVYRWSWKEDEGGETSKEEEEEEIWGDKSKKGNTLAIVGVYEHLEEDVYYATDLDGDKIMTVSCGNVADGFPTFCSTIKVWNKTTCECLITLSLSSEVSSIKKTRDGTTLIYGFRNGLIEHRRASDFQIVKTIQLPRKDEDIYNSLIFYCELEDGTFILDYENELQCWDLSNQTLLQTFTGHDGVIFKVIDINHCKCSPLRNNHLESVNRRDASQSVLLRYTGGRSSKTFRGVLCDCIRGLSKR